MQIDVQYDIHILIQNVKFNFVIYTMDLEK